MMPDRWHAVKTIFEAALLFVLAAHRLTESHERLAWLERSAGRIT
jgi:hypothetical protein